jgi:hypothetical protein
MQYIQLQGQVASALDTPINGAYNLFIDTSDNLIKVKDENGNLIGGGGASITEVTYSELSASFFGANLTAGQYYKITDYQTFYDQPNYDAQESWITSGSYNSGSIEPLVVFATSTSSLSPYAYSTDYPKDTIKYDISWNQTEMTNNPAKGLIYERIDEAGNRTDYDWRNVRFKRYRQYYAQNTYQGKVTLTTTDTTGSIIGVGTNFDNNFEAGDVIGLYNPNTGRIGGFDFYEVVAVSGSFYMGVTGSYYYPVSDTYYSYGSSYSDYSPFQTNTVSVGKEEAEYYTFDTDGNPAQNGWYNNYLGDNNDYEGFRLSNNVFRGGDYRDNYFGSNVVGNTFNDDMYGNKCGRNFQYNVIEDDFDNNTIGDTFQYNFMSCDFQENIIANNFSYNMIADDDGVDFNFNIINGNRFEHNWTIGYDHFHSNIITDDFYNNVFYGRFGNNLVNGSVNDNFFDGDTDYNQFKQTFYGNKIYSSFQNNVLNSFYENTMLDTFYRNNFKGNAYGNILSGSFFDNTLGDNFYNNTFAGVAAYNQIGSEFYSNTLGSDFGVGYGDPRANKIGNNVRGNTIGEYFYSNTISDNFIDNTIGHHFQQNVVLANNVNNVNFNEYYGNITSSSIANPNVGGSDGVYTLIPTTTNGQGIDATFDVTITSGTASAAIVNVGKLYETEDTLTITGSLIGGGTNLVIDVDTVTDTPMVYGNYDTTIQKASNGDVVLSVFMPGEGYFTYITQNITQTLP